MRVFSVILLSLLVRMVVHAGDGLVFTSETLTIKATPEQDVVNADFEFTNHGAGEARVLSVLSGCQCLEAVAPPGAIPSGGRGTVHGVFKVGAFQGRVEKQMMAKVQDSSGERDVLLTVVVEVPEVIRIEPNTLTWIAGAEPTTQSFTLRVVWPEKIRLLTVDCSREEFTLSAETLEDGRLYKVSATPRDTAAPVLGLVQFRTDSRFPKFRDPMAFVTIKSAP